MIMMFLNRTEQSIYLRNGLSGALARGSHPEGRIPHKRWATLHSDNGAVHNLKSIKEKMFVSGIIRMEHYSYSSHLPPCEFFSSFRPHQNKAEKAVLRDEEELFVHIREIMTAISGNSSVNAFSQWTK
jgi:hypothetical protein